MQTHWSEKYVSIPYDEANCAELVHRVMFDRWGKSIYLPAENDWRSMSIGSAVEFAEHHGDRVFKPVEADIVLMSGVGRVDDDTGSHVGIFVPPGGHRWVLHALEARGAMLTPIMSLPRMFLCVEGFYRWR